MNWLMIVMIMRKLLRIICCLLVCLLGPSFCISCGIYSRELGDFNQLICLLSGIKQGEAAYQVFEKFEEFECVRDADTYYYTTEALCKSSMFDIAASVSWKMVTMGMLPDAEKIGKLIYYLYKGKNKCPPRSSIDALIRSLTSPAKKDNTATQDDIDKLYRENICLALDILDTFSDEDRKFASFQPFSSVCQALCKIGDVDKANGLLYSMIKSGPPPGSGYAEGGAMVEARRVLEEAKQRHAKLTPPPYHIMIIGYCKLEQFDEAVKLLAEMEDYGPKAIADAYKTLIESLCINVLDWEMAERLQEEMKEKGLCRDGRTRGLISAVKELEAEGKATQEILM